ncbi:MAG: hypothetical protein L0229_06945 [Blastocatellia bacterium]|nr:hypothetical protein [Blastocatellia bacterium]
MKRIFSSALILMVLIAAAVIAYARPQAASSVVGRWDFTVETPMGARPSMLVIKQEGDKLTAVAKGERGERPYDKIMLNGNEITLVMTIQFQGQDMVITYKGMVDKDSMKGEADFGGLASGEWNATRHKEMAAPAAGSASASNISGVWTFNVETQAGSGSPTFTFKQEGETLSGSYKGQFGEGPITGTVKGSDIMFSVKINAQGQDIEVVYSGKIEGPGQMKGTVKLGEFGEGTWTGKKQ